MEALRSLLLLAGVGADLLIGLVVVVLGAALLRRVHARAGTAVAVAGVVYTLFGCALGSLSVGLDRGALSGDVMTAYRWCVPSMSSFVHLVFWGLLAFAAVSVAKATAEGPGVGGE